ncbi:chemotaxis protein CheB [Saccharothrix syringae]|uniref:protein-glutamate methylesterase n=1 Tax=Saccharothrix syringae TaxID=103733 RepID=A0A5Q0H1Q6_SACSY|nr:chemotaxis protein CheB [Saccharothrix syringae]QFZ19602.1 chemotaxis protein CheB [Saccharothrix syringae]
MAGHDVVVIGASAGGLTALRRLLADLPAGLPASVLVVVHTTDRTRSRLAEVLADQGRLPAAYAVPGQRLTRGLLTVAPPGQHLVVTADDTLRLTRGPLVHRTRPAVDPLLNSAAEVCGPRVLAVVLSGLLQDGAEGAAAVAAAGGAVLVQDPADAHSPDMPRATLARVPHAGVRPAARLGSAIADLVGAVPPEVARRAEQAEDVEEALRLAVSQLRTHAAAQYRLQRRFDDTGPLVARFVARAARAQQAADLIASQVVPLYQPRRVDKPA